MKSKRAKVLHELGGSPLIVHVVRAAQALDPKTILVVVGHQAEEVEQATLAAVGELASFVVQAKQRGTGDAVESARSRLESSDSLVLVLSGDVPLIKVETLRKFIEHHQNDEADCSILSVRLENPTGYGRIVRDAAGEFVEIVEQADATAEQRDIHEVFPSYYCVKSADLIDALGKLKNENAKGEYYLTDIYGILRSEGKKIAAVQAVTAEDVLAVNTRVQQAEVDALMQDRIQRVLRDAGVTIVSPMNTYIESGVTIGQDTVIQPFSFIGAGSSIGRDCVIGPFTSVPRDSVMPDGAVSTGSVNRSGSVMDAT
jgi:bifunctional UDP-N-acetylglucosamine pyrophosphorylase/glucosamine-1-phosphate N-acetyltransferase